MDCQHRGLSRESGTDVSAEAPAPLRAWSDDAEPSDTADEVFGLALVELRSYIRRLVRDASDADDIVQDVSLIALDKTRRPEDARQLMAWCKGLARNVVAHFYRTQLRRRKHLAEYALATATRRNVAVPEDVVAVRELVGNAVSSLDERSVELLRDRYVLEKTAVEIADRVGGSPAAIRMKLMRLRRRRTG